jgi:hypothetical protein
MPPLNASSKIKLFFFFIRTLVRFASRQALPQGPEQDLQLPPRGQQVHTLHELPGDIRPERLLVPERAALPGWEQPVRSQGGPILLLSSGGGLFLCKQWADRGGEPGRRDSCRALPIRWVLVYFLWEGLQLL